MNELASILQKTKLLQYLSPDTILSTIIPQGRLQEYTKGAVIFSAQDKVDHFHIVVSGRINTMHLFADGSCSISGTLKPLYVLGLDLICTRTQTAPYYAIAAVSSSVFSFPAALILKPGSLPESERLDILSQLLVMISHLNMQKDYRLAILSQNSLRQRIIIYLSMQASKRQTETFTIPFSREELASYLCVNRSALSHQLSLMKKEGLIDFKGNTFKLLNRKETEYTF